MELKQFGDLEPGDQLINSDGKPTTVTAVYDKHIPDKMFELEMEDGQVVKASGNHLWYCETDIDKKNKSEYFRLAKEYFANNSIPQKLDNDEHYPLIVMMNLFGDDINTQIFIERVCRTIGYCSYTPVVSQELMKSGNAKVSDKEEIFNYSYNNLIEFLSNIEGELDENNFMFGEVRTTEEIFKLAEKGIDINIPTVSEMRERGSLSQ